MVDETSGPPVDDDGSTAEAVLPEGPTAPGYARRYVRAALVQWERLDLLADAELLVSELVTNAIVHGEGTPVLRLMLGDTLRMEVSDEGAGVPVARTADIGAADGRGLMLVQAVAKEWGYRTADSRTTVWCDLTGDS